MAGLTQDAVPPGGTFTYEFVARDAGTYWYHSHQNTTAQILLGLFGALVVEPRQGSTEARDHTVVLHGAPDGSGGVDMNGAADTLRLAAKPGETVRLRSSTPSPRAWTARRRRRSCSARPTGSSPSTAAT